NRTRTLFACLSLIVIVACGATMAWAGSSDVLAEVRLKPSSKIEKAAGIWVDGQYLGYLKEMKGSKKILLLPGRHQLTARLTGYLDFETEFDVAAGQTREVRVAMRENLTATYPDPKDMARVKLKVEPSRAAVFVNDRYVGHVDQFRGFRKSLGLKPGNYKIHITLPGYQPFDTEITLLKQQKYAIETTLQKGGTERQPLLSERNEPSEPVAEAR
ncbi:MAG: PEGA domain-containing protein, partial [Gammaproteobacteria bacterium]|nr:PEGA domain-containing protein [Gammaproteobacteria bacterium]